ncbi:hypothetical protein DFH07DRAFT_801708 [Mycena maculata]|uniref:Uncharacterized protein n=1 Tax=Mycena maculata TaxID=230809 RepID=A0AAD7JVF1_9AGAR|nr:hypothetical protein DFH07DRAFT_801708 [Mycena maculata]
MTSSQNPSDPTYRLTLGTGKLVLRWSTAADRAGCSVLSCLAMLEEEGKESDWGVRYYEPFTDDAFYAGSSTNWALCVDTSPIEKSIASADAGSYADIMRAKADSALERVVALVYFLPVEFAFEGDAARVPIGRARIVACKAAYRQRGGGENIMKALFEMVHARAESTGCGFMVTSGIPGHYRTQGYEYALNMGRGLITHASTLDPATPADTPSPFSLRLATLDDLPALRGLVCAQRTTSDIFVGVDAATLHTHLRWLLGNRPAVYTTPDYPVRPFFVLEKRDTPNTPPRIVATAGLYNSGAPTAIVHPLLWDGEEDASAVTVAMVRELVPALKAIPAAGGSFTKLQTFRWILPDAHPLRRWLLAHELAVPMPDSSRYGTTI